MGNENSTISEPRGEQLGRVPPIEPRKLGRPATKARRSVDFGVHPEQHGKKSQPSALDNDDTFTNYIQRAKYKIRSISNIGRNHHPAPPPDHVANVPIVAAATNNNNTKDDDPNKKDKFSDFIQHAKKKLRTKSIVGKGSSFKRG